MLNFNYVTLDTIKKNGKMVNEDGIAFNLEQIKLNIV